MCAVVTDLGALFNFELDRSGSQLMWFNCWAAKEIAGALNTTNKAYHWSKRGLKPAPSGHLKFPLVEDVALAADVISLASFGDHSGVLVNFAIGRPTKQKLWFSLSGQHWKSCRSLFKARGQLSGGMKVSH
jgi:hypothetical protein